MSYKTYQEYKNSNNIWAGDVPTHWELHKIKNLIFFQEGPGLRNWQFTDNGVRVICVTNITSNGIDFSNYEKFISEDEYKQIYSHFTVNQGDLLLSSSGNSWGKVAEYNSDETVILNTSTIRINKNPTSDYELEQPYIKWALQSEYIREQLGLMMTGSCQPNFGPTHLAKISILMPSIEEQQQIANYLDKKTAKIDATIAKNEELIQLLEEKRVALINQVVTKGLNPDVPMKDSGVEWIGTIPKHWEIAFLKRFTKSVSSGKTKNIEEDGKYPLHGSTGIIGTTNSLDYNGTFILVARVGAHAGKTHIAKGKMGITDNTLIVDYTSQINYKFLFYVLTIYDFKTLTIGSGQPLITGNDVKNIKLAIPPLNEQNNIVYFLDSKISKIDSTLSKINKNITLLEEYKTSLIHHVVTGKIDVRSEEI